MSSNSSKAVEPTKRRVLYSIGLPAWVFAGFMLAQLLVVEVVRLLQEVGVAFESFNAIIFNFVIGAIVYVLAILIVFGVPWALKKRSTTRKDLGIQRFPGWMDIVWAPAGLVVYFILTAIVAALATNFLPFVDYNQAQENAFSTVATQSEYTLAFISLVIFAPIAEEILFRGYLFGKLRKHAPLWIAILITSLLFAALHLGWNDDLTKLQWNVALDVFSLSIVLCLLRVMTGSLWASILLHMLKNGIAFYFLFINPSALGILGG